MLSRGKSEPLDRQCDVQRGTLHFDVSINPPFPFFARQAPRWTVLAKMLRVPNCPLSYFVDRAVSEPISYIL